MIFRVLFLILLVLGFASSVEAAPPKPEFGLHFIFTPPFEKAAGAPVGAWLDVCGNESCANVVDSIPLRCNERPVPNPALVNIGECSASSALTRKGPNANFELLSHPVTLRLRVNNRLSLPFYFAGGVANIPAVPYRFNVTPNGRELMVIPQQ